MRPIMAALNDVRWALNALWHVVFDAAVLATVSRPPPGGAVCIVQLGATGDFVLWLAAGRRLARHYRASGRKLVMVANAAWAQWAREFGIADEIWEIDPPRFGWDFRYRADWLRRMRAAAFGEVVQPTHSRSALWGDSLVRAGGAPRRIGSAGDCAVTPAWLKRIADRWFTGLIDCGAETRMELLRHADFLRGLGIADFRAARPVLEAGPLPPGLPAQYAVLVPGAGWDGRAWPAAAFADIGRRLAARGLTPVVVGAPEDRPMADMLLRELQPDAVDRVGRTTLADLAAILAGARLVVSNETGPAHIAAATGTPVVCIVGGGHFGRFMPHAFEEKDERGSWPIVVAQRMDCFGCNWRCIYPRGAGEAVKCVREVAPAAVWRQVEACLARPR